MEPAPVYRERRQEDAKFTEITRRIDCIAAKHNELADDVRKLTAMTATVAESTSGLVETWEALTGGLKVLNALGKAAKWVTYLAGMLGAIAAAWYTFKNGSPGG